MAKRAVVLVEGALTHQQSKLVRMLDFFGVPWKTVDGSRLFRVEEDAEESVVFGSAEAIAAALKQAPPAACSAIRPAAFYAYVSDRTVSEQGLRALCGDLSLSLHGSIFGELLLSVARDQSDVAGPMAGLEVSVRLRNEDAVVGTEQNADSGLQTVISAGGNPIFLRFHHSGVPFFFCASSHIVDIDQTLSAGFYDVKQDFCSAVPLVMFVKYMFPDVGWHPQELGACLIVDDPLLRPRYGSCDFEELRELMSQHDFTTNIAFIPWNWRRTSPAASEFFKNESRHFSVSIHGCDHIGAEFGTSSMDILDNRAKLAQTRMRSHKVRTGIKHDSVMVFPQGVFSSVCPEALKRNGFMAAVNTETVPVDVNGARTRIRDVWDVAITTYCSFPIFTRRYPKQGLENFAFDLLLGKPCLIVSHHDFFKESCSDLLDLIQKLRSLHCDLHWRPLGDVIRRSCRRRTKQAGVEKVEMYGNELLLDNPSDQETEVRVRKFEEESELIEEVRCDGEAITWTSGMDHLSFSGTIAPGREKHFQVTYRAQPETEKVDRSLRFELAVAARRILSEFRDDYLSRSLFLSTTAASLKSAFSKSN
jgi:hypothetical protein